MSGVSGNGAVKKPSFIDWIPPAFLRGARSDRGGATDLHPATGPRTGCDRVADQHLFVSVRESGISRPFSPTAGCNVRVYRPEEGCEGIGKPLDMARRQGCGGPGCGSHERRVPKEQLVGPVAMTQPQLVRGLRIPGCGVRGSVNLPLERILSAGADLRHAECTSRSIFEAEENRGNVFGR